MAKPGGKRGPKPKLRAPSGLSAEPVTRAAFARLIGADAPRVTRWIAEGAISGAALAGARIVPSLAAAQLVERRHILPPLDDPAASVASIAGDAPRALSFDQAQAANETLKAHRSLLALRRERGEAVDRAMAEGLLFAAAREMRDAWLNWPARVAAIMAAELGVQPARLLTVLEAAVRAQLAEMADPKADFAASVRGAGGGSAT